MRVSCTVIRAPMPNVYVCVYCLAPAMLCCVAPAWAPAVASPAPALSFHKAASRRVPLPCTVTRLMEEMTRNSSRITGALLTCTEGLYAPDCAALPFPQRVAPHYMVPPAGHQQQASAVRCRLPAQCNQSVPRGTTNPNLRRSSHRSAVPFLPERPGSSSCAILRSALTRTGKKRIPHAMRLKVFTGGVVKRMTQWVRPTDGSRIRCVLRVTHLSLVPCSPWANCHYSRSSDNVCNL